MSLSKTAEATRAVLKERYQEALNGTLTLEDVVAEVKRVVPQAHREGIYNAIEAYGPIGEGDKKWARRAQLPQIPSWFFNPRTGEPLE